MNSLTPEQVKEHIRGAAEAHQTEVYYAFRDALIAHDAAQRATIEAQAQRIRELEEALQEMVDMEASGRCGASEEYLLHEWPKRYTAACTKADEVLRQQKREP